MSFHARRGSHTSIIPCIKASRAQMRSICLRLAKCRHDTLIQSKRKQQIAIFLQFYVTIRVTPALFFIRSRHFHFVLAIFISFSPFSFRSRHFPYMKLRDCSKIVVFLKFARLLLHLNAISTRAFILQKSAGKNMVLFAILMHSFGQP